MSLAFLSTYWLLTVFILAAAAIWVSGVKLTVALDKMSNYFNIGEAMGGMIFLAIVTNLPEIAITGIAGWNGNLDIAVSNILGGIAIQTVVLVLIDYFGVGKKAPLSFKSSSIGVLLEGIFLILILAMVIVGKQTNTSITFLDAAPIEWGILGVWLIGIYLIYKNPHVNSRKKNKAIDDNLATQKQEVIISKQEAYKSTFIFVVFALITLCSGLVLELCSEALAERFEISNVLFGATFLAMVTALPEISTGIESAKLKDYQMAVSDIFGGNSFLPVLLLVGSIICGKSAIDSIDNVDIYLTALGILLTGIYMIGLTIKSQRQVIRMGYDSLAILVVYLLGIVGLVYVN
jgi:cation:H+ antiporter